MDTLSPDRGVLEQELRQQGGLMKIALQIEKITPDDPGAQIAWIQKAKARGASLLLVEPVGAEAVASLLSKTRDEGIPVVLLRRSLKVEGKPLPVVTHLPFQPQARELVLMAVEDCKLGDVPLDGGALIASSEFLTDSHAEARAAAMRAALKEAGVTRIESVTYKETEVDAQHAIGDFLTGSPSISIVVSEDQGMTGAYMAREDDKEHRRYAVIGSVGIGKFINVIARTEYSAYVDRNMKRLGRQALQVVQDVLAGKSVPDQTEIPYIFQRTKPMWVTNRPSAEPADKLMELSKPAIEASAPGNTATAPADSAKDKDEAKSPPK
jgi:ABC-type sugar transport system substrate-binding protein